MEPETASVPLPCIPFPMAPPPYVTEFETNVECETVTVPPNGLSMPPPSLAWLCRNRAFVTVMFAPFETIMPPDSPPVLPCSALSASSMVMPWIWANTFKAGVPASAGGEPAAPS